MKNEDPIPIEQTDGLASGRREIVLWTGKKGYDLFQHTLEVANGIGMAEWLLEKKAITLEQKNSFVSMLESSDWENFYLAIELLKLKQDGITIHGRGSQLPEHK